MPQPTTHKFTVRGIPVQTRTPRRYIVVAFRERDWMTENGIYVQFARVEQRTDNIATARRTARRYWENNRRVKCGAVVFDTVTRQEV